jgi:23S rRNA pseudouridine1911/1915/1917 synthase
MKQVVIGKADAGSTVAGLLWRRFRLPWPRVSRLCGAGSVRLGGTACSDPNRRLRAGETLEVGQPKRGRKMARAARTPTKATAARAQGRRAPGQEPRIVFADAHIVVVDKPAGLTTVRHAHEAAEYGARDRRFLPPTLVDLLPPLLAKSGRHHERIRAVHRLDKDTSGLVVLARTAEAERDLGRQFRAHSIERHYLALVRGQASPDRIESYLIADRGDGRRGSSAEPGQGQRAVTHVRVIEELEGFSLVECRLETGRTHQVRIHLGERGTPLCGERVYDRPLHGQPLPDSSGAGRPALHAAFLAIDHPKTEKRMMWTSRLPRDMSKLLTRLRGH